MESTIFRTNCPAHDDQSMSLFVREMQGIYLYKCKAGCPSAVVIRAVQTAQRCVVPGCETGMYDPPLRCPGTYCPKRKNRPVTKVVSIREDEPATVKGLLAATKELLVSACAFATMKALDGWNSLYTKEERI